MFNKTKPKFPITDSNNMHKNAWNTFHAQLQTKIGYNLEETQE